MDDARAPPLPGAAEEYVRDSIHSSLGLPVSDRSLRLKLLASEEQRHRLQDHVFSLEEDLRAAQRRIDLLKAEAAMNAAGLRRCVEDKEAVATAYAQLNAKCTKECELYERDLERAMESCDDLARENTDLRARLHQNADVAALEARVQELEKDKETLKMNLDTAEAEVITLSEDNRVLDEENKRLLGLLEKERQRRSERKKSASTSIKNKRKSSSLRDGSPAGRALDFDVADSSRHPLSPLPHNSPPDYRAHKK
ncbi:hypothetical protein HU200_040240 [Digitaria exilis]|uniref:Paramyosin n=1 Tax=Digitaria exilis TaxID=1010633 RepID=A0A835EKF0_9POAL|nr:hypothetical protein HU200_040240 [Digitaria exilis]CAB3448422.1 unnamed protein product [Digitaria exilis]CAB3451606.1 unnamed protein product [Digitaria exilis]